MPDHKVETRNIGLFPQHWKKVDDYAQEMGMVTARGPNTSMVMLLYASSGELVGMDDAGNTTTLTPHNFSLIPGGPSEPLAWSYYSERDGKAINVDMLKLARLVEELTDEQLVYIADKMN